MLMLMYTHPKDRRSCLIKGQCINSLQNGIIWKMRIVWSTESDQYEDQSYSFNTCVMSICNFVNSESSVFLAKLFLLVILLSGFVCYDLLWKLSPTCQSYFLFPLCIYLHKKNIQKYIFWQNWKQEKHFSFSNHQIRERQGFLQL